VTNVFFYIFLHYFAALEKFYHDTDQIFCATRSFEKKKSLIFICLALSSYPNMRFFERMLYTADSFFLPVRLIKMQNGAEVDMKSFISLNARVLLHDSSPAKIYLFLSY